MKLKRFRLRSQEQWGVPSDLVSPLGWKSAIFELSSLEHDLTPSVQLQVLTRTVKAIYNEFKYAVLPAVQRRQPQKDISSLCIAADDLVPIFIFIFCQQRGLKHCLQNRDLMWGLCHPDQLRGEGGYYLTVYESAIECVLNENEEFSTAAESYAAANAIIAATSTANANANANANAPGSVVQSQANSYDLTFSSNSAHSDEVKDNNSNSVSDRQSRTTSLGLTLNLFRSSTDATQNTNDHRDNRTSTDRNNSVTENPLLKAFRLSTTVSDDPDNTIRESFA
jgi:hypothetical protein